MNLFMMALLLSLHVARKVTGDLTPSQKHCENVSGCKDFNILVQSASNLMNSITKEAAGKSTNMQVSVCIQSSMPSNSGTESTPSRGGTDVRPENEPIHSKATDCSSLQQSGITKNGVYKIWPKFLDHSINVYCDMENNGGGWTVIQRRGDFEPHINFYETWKKYREGFGDLNKEFWLGNDAIFALTNQEPSRLRVDLEDFEGNATYAEYGNFLIRSEVENYRMIIANYEGTAGDAMLHHNDADFSTKDKAVSECPVQYKGAWWYKACHLSNLNGLYLHGTHESYANGVNWKPLRGYHYSLKTTEMKIRPANR